MEIEQSRYLERVLLNSFDFEPIEKVLEYQLRNAKTSLEFELDSLRTTLPKIQSDFIGQKEISRKFKSQISRILQSEDHKVLMDRLEKGSNYFLDFLSEVQKTLLNHLAEVEQLAKAKTYRTFLEELDQLIMKTISEIEKAAMMAHCVYTKQPIPKESPHGKKRIDKRKSILEAARQKAATNPDLQKTKTGKKRKKPLAVDGEKPQKAEKGSTYKESYELLQRGLSVAEVAKKRDLVAGTIEGHVAKGIEAGVLKLEDHMDKNEIEILSLAIKKAKSGSAGIFAAFKGKYSYGKIRMVQASLKDSDS